MPLPSMTKISLKIAFLNFHPNLPGVNELKIDSKIVYHDNSFGELTKCSETPVWPHHLSVLIR